MRRHTDRERITVGLTEALTLLFIALKLTHVIDWPWLGVLAPELAGCALYVLLLAGVVVAAFRK